MSQEFYLSDGSHETAAQGTCFMEAASMLAGESFTDTPKCVCPTIRVLGIAMNDMITDDARRNALLLPLVPKVLNTSDEHWQTRFKIALDVLLSYVNKIEHFAYAAHGKNTYYTKVGKIPVNLDSHDGIRNTMLCLGYTARFEGADGGIINENLLRRACLHATGYLDNSVLRSTKYKLAALNSAIGVLVALLDLISVQADTHAVGCKFVDDAVGALTRMVRVGKEPAVVIDPVILLPKPIVATEPKHDVLHAATSHGSPVMIA